MSTRRAIGDGGPSSAPERLVAAAATRSPMGAGWIALAAAFVMLAVYRAVTLSFSILIVPLESVLQAQRSTVALIFTSQMCAYAAGSLASGAVIHRFGPRKTIALGGALFGAGLAFASLGHSLPALILALGVLCGLGIAFAGLPAIFVVLSTRFEGRAASAMGIAAAGMGVGVLVLIPAMQWASDNFGWRATWVYSGLIFSAVTAVCAVLLKPGESAPEAPARRIPSPGGGEAIAPTVAIRMLGILRSRMWRAFACANFLMGAALFGIVTHQVALFTALGWTALGAATALGVVNLLRSLAGPLWGSFLDRRGVTAGYGLSTILAVLGLACALGVSGAYVSAGYGLVAFIVGFGIGAGGSLPTNAALGSALFEPEDRGIAWGLTDTSYAMGGALGAWAVGQLFDLRGDYDAAIVVVIGQLALSYLIIRRIDATVKSV